MIDLGRFAKISSDEWNGVPYILTFSNHEWLKYVLIHGICEEIDFFLLHILFYYRAVHNVFCDLDSCRCFIYSLITLYNATSESQSSDVYCFTVTIEGPLSRISFNLYRNEVQFILIHRKRINFS